MATEINELLLFPLITTFGAGPPPAPELLDIVNILALIPLIVIFGAGKDMFAIIPVNTVRFSPLISTPEPSEPLPVIVKLGAVVPFDKVHVMLEQVMFICPR